MAEDRAWLYRGHVALEDMQVGAADGGGVDLDDGVRRRLDGGAGDGVPGFLTGAAIGETVHGGFPLSTSGCAGVNSPAASVFLALSVALGSKDPRSSGRG